MNCRKIIQARTKLKRIWLADRGRLALHDEARQFIESNLCSDEPATRLRIADRLVQIGNWHAVNGQIALIDGDIGGWRDIHRGCRYEGVALRVFLSELQTGKMLGRMPRVGDIEGKADRCALMAAYALTVSLDRDANYFESAICDLLNDPEAIPELHWEYHNIGPFILQLIALLQGEEPDGPRLTSIEGGPYQEILDAWGEPECMENAIRNAAEFHCQRIEDKSDLFFSEFRDPPFDFIAIELLAVYHVRSRLGMPSPVVDHPLLTPPFNTLFAGPSHIEDPLLRRVEALL